MSILNKLFGQNVEKQQLLILDENEKISKRLKALASYTGFTGLTFNLTFFRRKRHRNQRILFKKLLKSL
jgi:hypothetical protein